MATYLSPGVYIEEVQSGPKPIAGGPTNVAAFVGRTERGPVLDPRRLTGWNDYLHVFGGFTDHSFTAESVFGFFENGGTACYVVRADASVPRAWRVLDQTLGEVFTITASSPGEWGNAVFVTASRDVNGGLGELYGSVLGADAALAAGAPVTIQVVSTVGAAPGMTLVVRAIDGTETTAQVTEVPSKTTLRVVAATADSFSAHKAAVYARQAGGAAALSLATGAGLQTGDLLLAIQASGARQAAAIGGAQSTGLGMALTLDAAFPTAVPGYEFAARRVLYRARIASAATTIPFSSLAVLEHPAPATGAANDRIVLASGLEAPFNTDRFVFPIEIAAGDVWLDAPLVAAAYHEAIALTSPTLDAVAQRFSFVPVGTKLVLVAQDNTETTLTRASGTPGFTGTIPAATSFKDARFQVELDHLTTGVLVHCIRAPSIGDWLEFEPGSLGRVTAVSQPAGAPSDVYLLDFAADLPAAPPDPLFVIRAWQATEFRPLRFGITARLVENGVETRTEAYAGLGLREEHPQYYAADGKVNQVSALITVGRRTATSAITNADVFPAVIQSHQAGTNGDLTPARIRLAFEALEKTAEPALLACPDALTFTDPDDQGTAFNTMIGHGEKMRRFSVVDLPAIEDDQQLLAWRQKYLDSTYAAAYAPHVRISNPRAAPTEKTIVVPPSGHVLGVFARTDNERGVHKAPANERVRSVLGPAVIYTQRRQDLLNPAGINLIRAFPQRGTRIWGARNATTDTQWQYVNVRRLFLYVENAIDLGTQWVVFEPNTDTTWLRVRVSVENFLNQVWRAGGLAGTAPEEAYRVRVGLGITMTETDVDLGLLIIEVGIAPSKPAEFVVFRISHKRLTE